MQCCCRGVSDAKAKARAIWNEVSISRWEEEEMGEEVGPYSNMRPGFLWVLKCIWQ